LKTNYVLCCWSGARRVNDPRLASDPAYYLRHHIKSLFDLPHQLTQISIMVPRNPDEPKSYRSLLKRLPSRIQGANVVVMERPNIGMSYGSFSDCFKRYRSEFDYYFFMEDDYVFTQPYFDQIHVDRMEDNPDVGYLCGLAWATPAPLHAGISNGIIRTKALEAVWAMSEDGESQIPHAPNSDYGTNERMGQIGQSVAIQKAGYKLVDWSDRYKILFREPNFSVKTFHGNRPLVMMEPI
jgi:hypothetical protein